LKASISVCDTERCTIASLEDGSKAYTTEETSTSRSFERPSAFVVAAGHSDKHCEVAMSPDNTLGTMTTRSPGEEVERVSPSQQADRTGESEGLTSKWSMTNDVGGSPTARDAGVESLGLADAALVGDDGSEEAAFAAATGVGGAGGGGGGGFGAAAAAVKAEEEESGEDMAEEAEGRAVLEESTSPAPPVEAELGAALTGCMDEGGRCAEQVPLEDALVDNPMWDHAPAVASSSSGGAKVLSPSASVPSSVAATRAGQVVAASGSGSVLVISAAPPCLGCQAGDELLRINGQAVKRAADVYDLMRNSMTLQLELRRSSAYGPPEMGAQESDRLHVMPPPEDLLLEHRSLGSGGGSHPVGTPVCIEEPRASLFRCCQPPPPLDWRGSSAETGDGARRAPEDEVAASCADGGGGDRSPAGRHSAFRALLRELIATFTFSCCAGSANAEAPDHDLRQIVRDRS